VTFVTVIASNRKSILRDVPVYPSAGHIIIQAKLQYKCKYLIFLIRGNIVGVCVGEACNHHDRVVGEAILCQHLHNSDILRLSSMVRKSDLPNHLKTQLPKPAQLKFCELYK